MYPLHPPHIFQPLENYEALPNMHILDVVQDPQGFLWFATQSGGLVRYDGHQAQIYAKSDSARKQLPTSFITTLEIGPEGKVWAGTGDAGLIVYDPATDTFTPYPQYQSEEDADKESASGVRVLFKDQNGTLWIGADNGVLSRFDPKTGNFEHVRMFQDLETDISALAQSRDNLLWVGTGGAGLFKFDPEQNKIVTHYYAGNDAKDLTSNQIRAVLEDQAGNLWVGTEKGLDRFDPKRKIFIRHRHDRGDRSSLSDDRITAIFQTKNGALWVGTENGANVLAGDGKSFIQYVRDAEHAAATGSNPIHVNSIYQDRGGVLWMPTPVGVRKASEQRIRFHPYMGAGSGHGYSTIVDGSKPGVLWIGTYNSGLHKLDREANRITVYTHLGSPRDPRSIPLDEWIMALYLDDRGRLWIGGKNLGLVWLDTKTDAYGQYLPDPDNMTGPTSADIQYIMEDQRGYLWLATWGGGLNRFNRENGSFIEFMNDPEDPTTLSDDYLYTIHADSKNPDILWIGTGRGGLNRFDTKAETATNFRFTPEGVDGFGYDSIHTIHQDQDGVLWLGTSGAGLIMFDPETKEKEYFSEKDGLPNNIIYGILPDDEGKLWMGTNGGGMAVYNPKDGQFSTYTMADGLISNEFIQNGYYRSASGELAFIQGDSALGYGGITVFYPSEIQPDQSPPPVVVSSFQLFNQEAKLDKPIWTSPELDLGYTDSVFSFEFTALSYGAPGQIRYAYQMEGLHDWVETNRRFVTYTNLDGGKYTFRVRAANRNADWNEENMAAIRLNVASPPWKTWWAYLLYALTGLSVVFGYLRYQARKVETLRKTHRLQTVERELELTGAVQSGFLPKSNQISSHLFHVYGFYRPADQAGGDWWWYEELDTKLTILVGDVTGHGPGPAMVTAAAATAFRIQGRNANMSLADRLAVCNEEVLRVGGGSYHMTMSAVEIDGLTGAFSFYSAGGQPIMRIRYDGKPRSLPCAGTPLGSRNFSLGKVDGNMTQGERMVIYTDGIPEMAVGQGRQLGMRRFAMICESTQGLDTSEAAQRIVQVSDGIRQNSPQLDDWTFVVLQWPGEQAEQEEDLLIPEQMPEGRESWTSLDGWSRPSQIDGWDEANAFDNDMGRGPGSGSSSSGPTDV